MVFGRRRVGNDAPVLVIAEIGINHEGDAEVCARMVEAAVAAGADAIKLQTIDPDRNYVPGTESHRLFQTAVLSREQTARMFARTLELGAEPFTTVGDFATLEWVRRLDPSGYKISSGLLTCLPIVARVAATGRPLLMSTGMALPEDVDSAVKVARDAGARDLMLLQCTSLYPAPLDRLNLAAIGHLSERYGLLSGFSDHSVGSKAAALAVAAGAVAIEKHFSLDPSRPSFDHGISLDPHGFKQMVHEIRDAEAARGRVEHAILPDVREKRRLASRYLGTIAPIAAGQFLTEANVGFLRLTDTNNALPAAAFDEILGTRAVTDLAPHAPLTAGCYRRD